MNTTFKWFKRKRDGNCIALPYLGEEELVNSNGVKNKYYRFENYNPILANFPLFDTYEEANIGPALGPF